MKLLAQASATFSAGHTVDDEWCGPKPHGHGYTVTVTWDRSEHPSDMDEWARIRTLVLDTAMELRHRDLNAQLGAAYPNVYGVAGFFMERLRINVPVEKVEVQQDDGPCAILEVDTDY